MLLDDGGKNPVEGDPCRILVPQRWVRWEQPLAAYGCERYTSECVPLVVWQITVYKIQPRTHRSGGRHRKLHSMMDHNNLALVLTSSGIESRKLKACSWLDPADHGRFHSPRNERWKFP